MIKAFLQGQWIYLHHILCLLAPGHAPQVYTAHKVPAQPVTDWSEGELDLLIDEGRRQLDRQFAELDQIRSRAQFVFVTSLALLGGLGGLFQSTTRGGYFLVFWLVSAASATWALLGAAAIMTVSAEFSSIDSAVLSSYARPVKVRLAHDYAEMLSVGENTVAARLTVHRKAVLWLLVGAYVGLLVWLGA